MLADTFRGFSFHINLKTIPYQPRGYTAADKPVYGANNAPNCAGLPNPPIPYYPKGGQFPNLNDGVNNIGKGDNQRTATGFGSARRPPGSRPARRGRASQKALINSLIAPFLGVPVDQMSDLAADPLRPDPGRDGGERSSERPGQEDPGDPGQAGHLHRRDHAGDRRAGRPDRQPHLPVAPATTRRSSPTPPAWSRATTSASPASRSAASRRSRSSTAPEALVSFNVAKSSIVTKSSTATIRYRNLVGQRYISLTQGVGDLDQMPEDSTIPMHAHPAGARPHGAVQRLQAAVRRAVARPTSTSSRPR